LLFAIVLTCREKRSGGGAVRNCHGLAHDPGAGRLRSHKL
jgi:hypothetical protein